jgi:hypothetical protein
VDFHKLISSITWGSDGIYLRVNYSGESVYSCVARSREEKTSEMVMPLLVMVICSGVIEWKIV